MRGPCFWARKKHRKLYVSYASAESRSDVIRTRDLCVPNAALYQTEPRFVILFRLCHSAFVIIYNGGRNVNIFLHFFQKLFHPGFMQSSKCFFCSYTLRNNWYWRKKIWLDIGDLLRMYMSTRMERKEMGRDLSK